MILKLLHGVLSTLAIIIAAYLIPGVQTTLLGAIILALALGAINLSIKPIIHIITLPINVITLGIFSMMVNVGFIILAATFVPGFVLPNFLSAVMFAGVLLVIDGVFHFGLPS